LTCARVNSFTRAFIIRHRLLFGIDPCISIVEEDRRLEATTKHEPIAAALGNTCSSRLGGREVIYRSTPGGVHVATSVPEISFVL